MLGALLEVGWKGLFAARLDDPLTDEVVVAEDGSSAAASGDGPVVIYDVRARVYRPTLGRFMQQDPLGTGVVVRESLRWHGDLPRHTYAEGIDVGVHFRDGHHAMAFAKGNSVGRGDPTGLFGFPIGPTTTMDLWTDHAQVTLEAGSDVRRYLEGLFGNFQINQSDDFDWAFDWSADDYDYSRTRTRPEEFWGDYGFISTTDDEYGETGEDADGPTMCGWRPKRQIPGSNFHHIATNKNWKAGKQWSKQLSALFQQAELSMNNKANLIELSKELHNKGRHSQKYHTEVFRRLRKAIGNLKGDEAQLALKNELARLSDDIAKGVLKLYD